MATASSSAGFDEVFDAVVVGSGAAGLAAALTAAIGGLSVLVVEKADTIGGSTAISGGAVWVPGHSHLGAVGLTESRAAVIDYLRAHLGNRLRVDMIEAFLDRGPEMIDFLERHTALRLAPRAVSPDYKPDLPGAAAGGRTLDPVVYDGRELGRDFGRLRAPLKEFLVFGGMMVNRKDIDTLLSATKSVQAFLGSAALVLRFARDRLSQKRGTRLLMGNALAARLFRSALDRAIPIRERHAARDLIVEDGRVVGLVVEGPSGPRRIGARRGVVLASGGFPGSAAMRQALLPHADRHYSMAPSGNGGDGIRLAQGVGGRIGTDNVGNAFWAPVSVMREADGTETRFPHLILDRAKPGLVAVDGTGRRFVNEANSYHDFVEAMHLAQETRPAIPAWLVCDAAFIRRYGLGLVRPGLRPLGRFLKSGYLVRGDTVETLARAMAVDPAALADTVARMNRYAETGTDPDFGKGSTAYNRYLGDAAHKPNPCLGPIRTAPYYAVRVWPGDIGTAAGLETDPRARVLGADGQPIPGLWACGNDMNSIMAGTYPSAGITLGPALTFGYIAGLDLASATP